MAFVGLYNFIVMAFIILCAALPVALYFLRKYRSSKWGKCNVNKNLTNKCFIVTGANSGLGKATVKGLLSKRARVIMACRNMEKAKKTINEIRKTIKTGELIPMELDLASLDSIQKFASNVNKCFPEIHVLINNAGVSVPLSLQQTTYDGFEMNFGVNHLGHFYLTNLLLDKLISSAPSRIVIVTSALHENAEINFEGPEHHPISRITNPSYNMSKLANIYFCRELAKRLPESVQTFAVSPGLCYTRLTRYTNLKWYQYILFAPIAFLYMRSAEQGAQTILHCALSDEVDGLTGGLFRDCKPYESCHDFKTDIQRNLWKLSEELLLGCGHSFLFSY